MRTMSVLQQWSRATMWIHIVITLFNSQTTEQGKNTRKELEIILSVLEGFGAV